MLLKSNDTVSCSIITNYTGQEFRLLCSQHSLAGVVGFRSWPE